MSARFVAHRLGLAVLASLLLATTGCAAQISSWIVQTRNHQGDVALDHQNSADASIAYQLALRVQPTNAHARAGLVAVQARIAQTLFTASRFDDAVKALDVANRYAPSDPRIEALRTRSSKPRSSATSSCRTIRRTAKPEPGCGPRSSSCAPKPPTSQPPCTASTTPTIRASSRRRFS
jgi:tetratricopeptide (TPR) repeat protein